MTRATVFGDRIDCTLLDLKYYYTREKQCKLRLALKKVKTAKFLQTFSTFEELVDWYGIISKYSLKLKVISNTTAISIKVKAEK